ncbi:putative PAS/PAC sensor protein [Kribbella flavida DSM 17836]|uniref:Putative PAS/PAC sensor protein n=1 Tax=Kribbella flavida (strain DSM 17836 / JCM 10339 / NBRC 14399) TaxID=479435 RepID=D2PQQ5_KRIFD|nr:SpoIIE family protein phosphatase [Kribbella flavida]ADB31038.1 putative PAS/PAC sensor protein [Kribbella flavida DSM 17836]
MTDRPARAEGSPGPVEDSAEEVYESAPSGHLSTAMDGRIVKINATLLDWIGLPREAVVGRLRFTDLLTVGGRLYHETHFAPLLRMQGEISGVALELKQPAGGRLPVLVSSAVKRDAAGEPLLIRTTVFDAHIRRAYEEELLRGRQAAEAAQRQAETDRARLKDALAVLQQSLLPATLPQVPALEVAAYYHMASPEQLGGDFYDVFAVDRNRWAFFLGDVCGKGPAAAAVTSLARYTLRAAAMHDPGAAIGTLNAVLHQRYTDGDPRYCTAVFGTLVPDPGSGRVAVKFASGGHPPPLLLRADGSSSFLDSEDGTLIGILPASNFPPTGIVLAPGDTLLLYTDGLTEARVGGPRDFYGDEALRTLATQYAGAPAQTLIDALSAVLHSFQVPLADDTALLAFSVPAPSHRAAEGQD